MKPAATTKHRRQCDPTITSPTSTILLASGFGRSPIDVGMPPPDRQYVIVRGTHNAQIVACCDRDMLCDRCVADTFAQLRGVAACRGERWAASVSTRRPRLRTRPWPAHAARAAAIARAKVADLTRDERLRELLAAELARWAARRWAHDSSWPS